MTRSRRCSDEERVADDRQGFAPIAPQKGNQLFCVACCCLDSLIHRGLFQAAFVLFDYLLNTVFSFSERKQPLR